MLYIFMDNAIKLFGIIYNIILCWKYLKMSKYHQDSYIGLKS